MSFGVQDKIDQEEEPASTSNHVQSADRGAHVSRDQRHVSLLSVVVFDPYE